MRLDCGKITGNDKMGTVKSNIVGIIGGIIGGFAMNLIGGYGITGFNVWSLFVATLGGNTAVGYKSC